MGTAIGVLLIAAGCGRDFGRAASVPDEDMTVSMESGGRQREYVVHTPSRPGSGKLPAVLIFHGGGGSPADMIDGTGFDDLADREGFVAVYPAGYEHSWNDGRGEDTKAGAAGVDDIAFVSAVIDRIIAEHGVDPARIYATGLSNGGMFTQFLGCALAGRLAAIAPVSGTLPQADEHGCTPGVPLPVLEIHGTADPIVPYNGGVVRVTGGHRGGSGTAPVLSVDATQALWRGRNRCDSEPVRTSLPPLTDDGTSVVTEISAKCAAGSRVELYSVVGGGHTWPGRDQRLPESLVGTVTRQFDAAEIIWRFCSGFQR
ncbi:alpha/beta hydrolase family esterase [Nocardia huaxiensis]|uniref:extracellular catalytic domain type 1 short-chain-length polyhydroxyalkanoate depolymerase n=1 Tax=Nocardia huaxiensis TaxID=2755382 RepID=UPI001E439C7F|nr:PHB depolymerase family esterase [Nocardia huaxiensis]UFS95920.1 dienelactone hydrolase family protein [Nocardia huaxiensis]